MWAKPRKVNEVPFVSGWLVPPGRLLRKSTKRVLSGWSDSPYRAKRLPKTPRTRLASRKFSNGIISEAHKGTFPLEAWPDHGHEPFVQHVVQENVREAR